MDKEARVGMLFAVTMILLGVTLFYIGNFQKSYSYNIEFFDINGLTPDSPVHFNGVPIGRVTSIELKETQTQPTSSLVPIKVTIAVDRSAKSHIRESTKASIRAIGILGDKFIRLYTPDYKVPELEEGLIIKTAEDLIDMEKLITQGKDLATDVTDITQSVQRLLNRIEENDGLAQRLIDDPELAEQTRDSILLLAQNFKQRKSVLGLLGNDPAFSSEMKGKIQSMTSSLDHIVGKLENSRGLFQLITEDEEFRESVQTYMLGLLSKLDALISTIQETHGLAHILIYDEAYAERVSQNLEKASFHLASILEKIDTGDGTVSKLLNEPQLYDGINDIVYGVENSGFSKWYINHKREKGEKLKEEESILETESK